MDRGVEDVIDDDRENKYVRKMVGRESRREYIESFTNAQ
jgi:hypothetical protein